MMIKILRSRNVKWEVGTLYINEQKNLNDFQDKIKTPPAT